MSSSNAGSSTTSKPAQSSVALDSRIVMHFKPARVFQKSVEELPPTTPPHHITGISFDDHGDTLITAAEDDNFRLYNCKSGKWSKTLYSRKYGITLPRFTHKNTNIIHASTKEDDTIRYHSLHDNRYIQYFKGHKKKVISLEMSPVDDGFLSGSEDNTVRLWDLRTPNARGQLNLIAPPITTFDAAGVVFAVGLNTHQKILLYDTKNYDKDPFQTFHLNDVSLSKISFPPRMPFMTSLSFSTNGKYLLVGTAGNAHYLMDAFDGYLLAKLEGFEGLERGKSGNSVGIVPGRGISGEEVCFTPDSKFVIGGDHTGKIHVWDLISNPPDVPTPDGQECRVIKPCYTTDGNSGPSRCVKFNPRFAMLATAGGELAFWLPDNAALQNDGDSKMENAEDARAKMDWK